MPSVSLGSLKAATWDKLENNTRAYQSSQVVDAINQAIKVLNIGNRWIQRTVEIGPSVAGRPIYRIPEDMVYASKCMFDGRILRPTQVTDLILSYPNAISDTTAAGFTCVERWASLTDAVWIHPADSLGGRSIQATGVMEPTKLVSDSDVMQLPNEASPIISDYAAHMVQFKLGGTPFNQSLAYFNTFREYLRNRTMWNALDFPAWKAERQQQKMPT